jgi:uncharacterized membrane protein YfcA
LTIAFAAIVLAAFAIEAAAGFGATIVTVTLAAQFLPIERVLAALVPVNLGLSSYIVARHWAAVDGRLLFRRILPWMGAGVGVGLALFQLRHLGFLKVAFAVFVVGLAAVELWRARRAAPARPLPGAGWAATLFGAGIVHGLFACGGPLAVYAIGREVEDKARFRATLSALWLVFNVVLVAGYVVGGSLGESTLRDSALLVPSLVLGIVAGEFIHHRVSEERFRTGVHLLLLFAGAALLARSLS